MRLILCTLFVIFAVVVVAYDQYDKKTNFQPVEARISGVDEQCYLEKVERNVLTKTTLTSDLLRCEVAEALTRVHPKWQGYAIKQKIEVRFAYVSPVDRATHTASHQMSAYPNGRPLRVGEIIPVLASKVKPDKTRSI